MSQLDTAVDKAVLAAKEAYDEADENPFDHGFAHIELDGRTSLAREMKKHDAIDADDSNYVTISGVSRYLTPQRRAYRAFVSTLDDHGVDTDHVNVFGRLD